MLILRLSMIMALNVFVFGDAQQGPTTTTSSGTIEPSVNSDDETFPSYWSISNITLNQNSTFKYKIDSSPTANQLILAQTNAKPSEPITQNNTWWIVQLKSCTQSPCEAVQLVYGLGDFTPLSYTFILQGEQDKSLSGFFFCFATEVERLESNPDIACHSYSDIFDINPAGTVPQSSSPNQVTGTNNGELIEPDKNSGINSESRAISVRTQTPTTVLTITSMDTFISFEGDTVTSVQGHTSTIIVATTTSVPTETPGSVGSTNAVSSATGGGRKTLSIGAIVGIALGGFVLALLIALAVIFFCRRSKQRRRTRFAASGSGPDQVMLSRSMDGGSNSQERFNEKDTAVQTLIHPNSNDSSFLLQDSNNGHSVQRHTLSPDGAAAYRDSPHDTPVMGNSTRDSPTFRDTEHSDHENESQTLQRHSALSTYDSTSSAPYVGVAASLPRRKPTTASHKTAVSALSHTLSASSSHSSQPPHSPSSQYPEFHNPSSHQHISQLRNIGEEEGSSPAHKTTKTTTTTTAANNNSSSRQLSEDGEARYGDTRHQPQVFSHPSGTLQAPFLSEPGMSAEEMARLEEEERRIDAAILAADEARKNKPTSGLR